MIGFDRIWLVCEPTDMCLGIDGLSARIQNRLGRPPCDGSVFAFSNRARTRVKLVVWDGTGVWLCQRRLHCGRFAWPEGDTPTFTLSASQWNWLIAGVQWQRLSAPAPAHWRV